MSRHPGTSAVKPLLALIAVAAAALAAPAVASAGLATITYRDVPIHADAFACEHARPGSISSGVRWHGSGFGAVQCPLDLGGPGGPWLDAAAEEEDQPDAGSPRGGGNARLACRRPHLGRGRRTGSATTATGSVRDLRASFIRSPELRDPAPRRLLGRRAADRLRAALGRRRVDPDATRPALTPAKAASVHHTAGPNGYSSAQAAAIMRGIQATT